ncbi:MAG: hypothetical protein K2X82_09580, partial [Gemmataceae bacterium]|nr:hypothetical protein [Gemmataceae bacterium]
MQQGDFENSDSDAGIEFPGRAGGLAVLLVAVVAGGCNPAGEAAPPAPPPPFAGATVRLGVADPRLAELLTPSARIWASRTGAAVEVSGGPVSPGVDVGVIPAGDLGALAERDELLPVPAAIREPGHPYQWAGVIPAFRGEGYVGWGGRAFALPLAGPGDVVVYRMDRLADPAFRKEFEAKFGRPPGPPATWEDFADLAGFLADRDKKPSLPPLPADPDRLVTLFSRVASCYDRPAAGEGVGAAKPAAGADAARREALGFQFRVDDG